MKKKYCADYWLYAWKRDQWGYVDALQTEAQAKAQMEVGTTYKIEKVYYIEEKEKEC